MKDSQINRRESIKSYIRRAGSRLSDTEEETFLDKKRDDFAWLVDTLKDRRTYRNGRASEYSTSWKNRASPEDAQWKKRERNGRFTLIVYLVLLVLGIIIPILLH